MSVLGSNQLKKDVDMLSKLFSVSLSLSISYFG